jgi:hypothetical protein
MGRGRQYIGLGYYIFRIVMDYMKGKKNLSR